MHRREAKQKQEEEQLNWIKSPINEEWHEDTQDWSQASTSPEREEQKINSIETEEEKNPSTYKLNPHFYKYSFYLYSYS